MRESFIFYKSFYDAIETLGEKAQLKLYKSIMKLNFNCCENVTELEQLCDDIETTLQQNRNVFAQFLLIKPQILANSKRYFNGLKGASHGALGGAPAGNTNAAKNNPKTTPNKNDNVNVNDNESKEESVKEEKTTSLAVQSPAAHTIKSERFTRPTLEEVAAYCAERGNSVDPQRFIDYYTSKGWKVGNAPMKDWRAAVRTWERKDGTGAGQRRKQQGDPMLECLQRLYAEAEEEERRNAENDGD